MALPRRPGKKATLGVVRDDFNAETDGYINKTDKGWCFYQENGKKGHNGPARDEYGKEFKSPGDIVTVVLDADEGSLKFWKNSESFGPAYRDLKAPESGPGTVRVPRRRLVVRRRRRGLASELRAVAAAPRVDRRGGRNGRGRLEPRRRGGGRWGVEGRSAARPRARRHGLARRGGTSCGFLRRAAARRRSTSTSSPRGRRSGTRWGSSGAATRRCGPGVRRGHRRIMMAALARAVAAAGRRAGGHAGVDDAALDDDDDDDAQGGGDAWGAGGLWDCGHSVQRAEQMWRLLDGRYALAVSADPRTQTVRARRRAGQARIRSSRDAEKRRREEAEAVRKRSLEEREAAARVMTSMARPRSACAPRARRRRSSGGDQLAARARRRGGRRGGGRLETRGRRRPGGGPVAENAAIVGLRRPRCGAGGVVVHDVHFLNQPRTRLRVAGPRVAGVEPSAAVDPAGAAVAEARTAGAPAAAGGPGPASPFRGPADGRPRRRLSARCARS